MDEALEAEYNTLIDDMVLVVAQKGEQAMKMSLEECLEYALKIRRTTRTESSEESKQNNFADRPFDSKWESSVKKKLGEEILSPQERRVVDWHFARLEYGCAASLNDVSLPYWNQGDVYGGFGGAHCMIKGGYSSVVESLGEGITIHLNHVITNVSYGIKEPGQSYKVKVSTTNDHEFIGDVVLVTDPLGCLKAATIQFSPPLPQWKCSSVYTVLPTFPSVFWDDDVDYFGATTGERNSRGRCFKFWNVRKTVGAPILIALVIGKAVIDGQSLSSSGSPKLFGQDSVPNFVAYVVTDWGRDPFSYASGEDYDILWRLVDNCLFFAGEATCQEHPDIVGGAMMSGLRDIGNDYIVEVEGLEIKDKLYLFELRGKEVEIKRDPTLTRRVVTPEALLKEREIETMTLVWNLSQAEFVEGETEESGLTPNEEIPAEGRELLEALKKIEDHFLRSYDSVKENLGRMEDIGRRFATTQASRPELEDITWEEEHYIKQQLDWTYFPVITHAMLIADAESITNEIKGYLVRRIYI
ncbi:hypothetical protein V8G54_006714 [Vigna mungo]|uniref:Amine oxidase domain-containing protein n=1 Tax=Vigna mungo TaxID=3915 RepID=A0AAQ3P2E9_VIGMU